MPEKITFSEQNGRISLEMTRAEYDRLLMILGFAAGAAMHQDNQLRAWSIIEFTNRINADNQHFNQYEIPEKYR